MENSSTRTLTQIAEELNKLADHAKALSLEAIQLDENLNTLQETILPTIVASESAFLIQQIEASIQTAKNLPLEISIFRQEFIEPLESESKQDPTIKKILEFRSNHAIDKIAKTYQYLKNERDTISIAVRELFHQELQSVFIGFCKEVSIFESFLFQSKQTLLQEAELVEDPWNVLLEIENTQDSNDSSTSQEDYTEIEAMEIDFPTPYIEQFTTQLTNLESKSKQPEQEKNFYSQGTAKAFTSACLTSLLKLNTTEDSVKEKNPYFFDLSAEEKRNYIINTERLYQDFLYAIKNFKTKLEVVASPDKLINTIASNPQYLTNQPKNYGHKHLTGERVLEIWNLALTFWFSNDDKKVNSAIRSLINRN